MIYKICKFCNKTFLDKTKNSNRSMCGNLECKKLQTKEYSSNRDKTKYKEAQKRFKAKNLNYLKDWRYSNKEVDRKLNREYKSKRLAEDINFRLAHNLRSRLNKVIKYGSAVKDLGCSIEELKKHIESQFSKGMSWDNYGEWHLDHIKPLAKYNLKDRNEFLNACHYTNLQPLWASDNLSKGDKYAL